MALWRMAMAAVLAGAGTALAESPEKLVWSDEFDRAGMPDANKWTYEQGYVRNNEGQYYTAVRRENLRVENGMLVIEARKESYPLPGKPGQTGNYTSASITTKDKAGWKCGRVEVRAKLPAGRGMWPAIWMLGSNIKQVGWPACGEIDIMENVGFNPDVIHATVHTEKYNHVAGTAKGSTIKVAKPSEAFHVYGLDWTPEKLTIYIDGTNYFAFANEHTGNDAWPYGKEHYLILNIAVGGSWGGQKGIDDQCFPQRMLIDYVRVYQREK